MFTLHYNKRIVLGLVSGKYISVEAREGYSNMLLKKYVVLKILKLLWIQNFTELLIW